MTLGDVLIAEASPTDFETFFICVIASSSSSTVISASWSAIVLPLLDTLHLVIPVMNDFLR